jgi:hypothetical protein
MAVWLIYVIDHLIDTARPAAAWEPPRKDFCRRHWHKFSTFAVMAVIALIVLASRFLRLATVQRGWELSLGVVGYFALTHLTPPNWRQGWPREIVVALLFTLGTFGGGACRVVYASVLDELCPD